MHKILKYLRVTAVVFCDALLSAPLNAVRDNVYCSPATCSGPMRAYTVLLAKLELKDHVTFTDVEVPL